jgi:hypothetical protein
VFIFVGILWGAFLCHYPIPIAQNIDCFITFTRTFEWITIMSDNAGGTNPLIRRGTLLVEKRKQGKGSVILNHLLCWEYSVFQGLNLLGGVLFALALKDSDLSLAVPLANGTSILANAVVDWILGQGVPLWPGVPGVLLLALGVALCAG